MSTKTLDEILQAGDAAALATLPRELRQLAAAGIFRPAALAAAVADVQNGDGPRAVVEALEEGDLRGAVLVAVALPGPQREQVLVALASAERSLRAAIGAAGGDPRQAPGWATRVLLAWNIAEAGGAGS